MSRTFSLSVIVLFASVAGSAPNAVIEKDKIVVTGVTSARGLNIIVAEGTEAEIAARPPVIGEWTVTAGKVVFKPKYPLKAGTRYRVVGGSERLEVSLPKPAAGKRTAVTQIYPTQTELPENVLRFYIEFNQPMPRGDVYKHVQIVGENGKPLEPPFVELDNELWNADQTRLTLLIDPGRIKKEVKPRVDLGPIFVEGKKYTLVVSGQWPTLDGTPLGREVRKPIIATGAVSQAIDPKAWELTAPSSDKGPLQVTFDRPLDHVLLVDSMKVIGPDGRAVKGNGVPAGFKNAWVFWPADGWSAGNHKLVLDPGLEDVCGNRIGLPFEVDLSRPLPKESKPVPAELPFFVGRR